MIAVDSSALMAILNREGDAVSIAACLSEAAACVMSAGTYLEWGVVAQRRFGVVGVRRFRSLVEELGVELIPVDREAAEVGLDAYLRFGKGSGHAANLNFGDCFAYALAKTRGLPLLFKGDDFGRTDVVSALAAG